MGSKLKRNLQLFSVGLAVMAMTACNPDGQSGMLRADRHMQQMMGNTAQLPEGSTVEAPGRRQRASQFSFQYGMEEAMFCQQTCAQGECPMRCQRIFHDLLSRGMSPDYYQFQPQVGLFDNLFGQRQQGVGYVHDYNTFEMANTQWVNDHRTHLNAQGGFQPMGNMRSFCNSPHTLAHESINLPPGHCENLDMRYLIASGHANNAHNHFIQGNPQAANAEVQRIQGMNQGCLTQGKSAGQCFKIQYGTYWGKRNVHEENAVIEADLKRTWDNAKALPKNALLRTTDGILNMLMTRAMIPVAQLDARLAAMNYNEAQRLNYYESMAAHYHNALPIPVYMTGGNCDQAYASSSQGAFVVGAVEGAQDQYMVQCAGNRM